MSDLFDLQTKGVIVLNNIFNIKQLARLIQVSEQCFDDLEKLLKTKHIQDIKNDLPSFYNFQETVTSVNICALNDYHNSVIKDILNLIQESLIDTIVTAIMGEKVKVNLTQSWLRKQYAPCHYHRFHHAHSWHQDGALGLNFPLNYEQLYVDIPLTNLITCWLPLTPCGLDRPGLELITKLIEKPLHFNYLKDDFLRKMFNLENFWIPNLNIGDVLIFLKGTLHQTYVNSTMIQDRISVEFRFFI